MKKEVKVLTKPPLSHPHLQTSCQPFVYFGKAHMSLNRPVVWIKITVSLLGQRGRAQFLLAPLLVISTWLPFNFIDTERHHHRVTAPFIPKQSMTSEGVRHRNLETHWLRGQLLLRIILQCTNKQIVPWKKTKKPWVHLSLRTTASNQSEMWTPNSLLC